MFRQLTDLRRGERARTALGFVVLLLVVGSYTIVKAVREAVFLSRFSVTELSLVALGLAAVSGTMVAVYLRATSGVAQNRVLVGSYVVVALTIMLLAIALRDGDPPGWLPWLLYAWSSLFGVFIVMQFWLLLSNLFDVREAKRAFAVVGIGAVMGGLVGGVVARALASRVAAFGLLLIAAAMLLAAALATGRLWKLRRSEPRAVEQHGLEQRDPWEILKQPSLARLLTIGLVLGTIVTTILDWQLKTVARHAFENHTEELAGFFGSVYAFTSVGSLLLQSVVSSWLLHNYGVGVARATLPLVLLLGFVGIFSSPVLPVSLLTLLTGARLVEGGVRFAINQPAVELSWLPLPAHARKVGRSLADTVGDRVGTGLAGVIWIAIAALSPDESQHFHWVAAVGIAIGVIWLLVLSRTQRFYVGEMRSALAQRAIDLESLWQSIGHERTKRAIVEAIQSGDPGRIAFSLYLLEGWDEELPDLTIALTHARADIRLQALRLLANKAAVEQRSAALTCLSDPDLEVREAAVIYLRRTAPVGPDPLLAGVQSGDLPVVFVRWLIQNDAKVVDPAADGIAAAITAAPPDSRVAMSRLLGTAAPDSAAPLLRALLDDADERVVEAAIRSAGRARALALLPVLAEMLHKRRWRARVIGALADVGNPALTLLCPLIRDEKTPIEVRRAIIRLAGASRNQVMAGVLMPVLDDPSVELSAEALRAISRLRGHTTVAIDAKPIRARLLAEAALLYRELLFLGQGAWPQARAAELEQEFLRQSIRDAANSRVDRIFRLLSLLHEPADVLSAFRGLKSPIKATRARGIDFLDNLVDGEVKRVVLPALEDADPARLSAIANRVLGIAVESRDRMIERLRNGTDPWLSQVATWSSQSPKEKPMGLSVVEKALKLRNVDVLARVSSEELAYIANIAEEIELAPDTPIYRHGDAPDALYVVVSGTIRLYQDSDEIGLLGAGEAFGSWALFDEAPRVASAAAAGPATVLKVDRDEFLELLGDRVELARAIFRAMVERIRSLAELAHQK